MEDHNVMKRRKPSCRLSPCGQSHYVSGGLCGSFAVLSILVIYSYLVVLIVNHNNPPFVVLVVVSFPLVRQHPHQSQQLQIGKAILRSKSRLRLNIVLQASPTSSQLKALTSSSSSVTVTPKKKPTTEKASNKIKRAIHYKKVHKSNDNANHDRQLNHTKDMMTMSVAGTILTLGILFILAGNGSSDLSEENVLSLVASSSEDSEIYSTVSTSTMKSSFQFLQNRMIESLEITGTNIVDAAVPLTASDIVSVAIGESIAGVIGASLSFLVSNLLVGVFTSRQQSQSTSSNEKEQSIRNSNYNNLFPTSKMSIPIGNNNGIVKMSDAMADTDYIITNVAVKEILSSSLTYVSPIVRTLIATGIAIIPYSIVKYNAQRQQQKDWVRQQALELQLIQEEDAIRQQQRENIQLGNVWKQIQQNSPFRMSRERITSSIPSSSVKRDSLPRWNNTPQLLDTSMSSSTTTILLDWVEIFADIVKWLQFDVLYTDFGSGQLLGSVQTFQQFVTESMLSQQQYVSILIGTECAIFGAVTALTSQIYADVLYKYFKLGPVTKQDVVNNRTTLDWYMIYISKIIYCAILFGTYGALKEPTESIVMAVGSGGVDNCYGSINYQYCIDTFVANNPVGPTPEAEFRSLITAAISFWNNHNQWFSYLPIPGSS